MTASQNAADFEQGLILKAREKVSTIVLPEGSDDRILHAADELLKAQVCKLIILGDEDSINERAAAQGLDLSQASIRNPLTDPQREEFAQQLFDLRKTKGITLEEALEQVQTVSYFGAMLVHNNQAHGMVSGAVHTTAKTIQPGLQIIKTKPGNSVVSSVFIMVLDGKTWVFGDCAVNPNPTSEQLAEIAISSAETAQQFGIDPQIAMLSYSTGASGTGVDVDRVRLATDLVREKADYPVAGPIQFDSALDPGVAAQKMPENPVAGHATVFIFPELDSGNITYKAVQRVTGGLAVGPILQGLNKPINDLSRGASVDDIVNTVAITAIQAQ